MAGRVTFWRPYQSDAAYASSVPNRPLPEGTTANKVESQILSRCLFLEIIREAIAGPGVK